MEKELRYKYLDKIPAFAQLVRVLNEIKIKTALDSICISLDGNREFCLMLEFANKIFFARLKPETKERTVLTIEEAMNFDGTCLDLSQFLERIKEQIDYVLRREEKNDMETAQERIRSQMMMMSDLRVTLANIELSQ